jgi:hypothetical protein
MATFNLKHVPARSELERVIEPLASYICAAEQPRAALMSALAVLLAEVKQTNRAALAHVGVHLGTFAQHS